MREEVHPWCECVDEEWDGSEQYACNGYRPLAAGSDTPVDRDSRFHQSLHFAVEHLRGDSKEAGSAGSISFL